MCHTDRIRQLDLALVSQTCCYDILCNITCCVSRGTVNFGAVFSGESSATVTTISTVSIYDDLSSCQTTVTVWSADYESSCRIYKEFGICIYHLCRKDLIEDIFFDIFVDLFLCYIRIVLCGQYDCIQAVCFSVIIIFYSYLRFSVRSQITQCAVFSYLCQLSGQFVCQRDGQRHIFFCLVGCETEHHTLISCSDGIDLFVRHFMFFCFQRFVDTHSDIGGLLVDGCDHTTVLRIKTVFSSVISDLTNGISYDFLDIHISFCCDLTHNQYQAGGDSCLAGYTAHRILFHQCVQDCIGNLVTDFVRMAFGYRFGSK